MFFRYHPSSLSQARLSGVRKLEGSRTGAADRSGSDAGRSRRLTLAGGAVAGVVQRRHPHGRFRQLQHTDRPRPDFPFGSSSRRHVGAGGAQGRHGFVLDASRSQRGAQGDALGPPAHSGRGAPSVPLGKGEDRCDGHLFITVLAYQAVQVIRRKLKEHGINESWESLREKLGSQCRITATFKQRNGKTLHVRQATQPEEELKNIYTKLGISPDPGGIQKMVI
jgi:hypothetical protein